MIAISLSFPSGRFHATPWGRHVNEGVPEWPPSPWRFLRALVATWKGKLDSQMGQPDVELLLRALIAPPQFVLPPANAAHTRHYMPWFKKGPEDKTLVFDAFVSLRRDAYVVMLWPNTTLPYTQRDQLGLLLEHLNFFGRAEAWCTARLLGNDEAAAAMANVTCRAANGARVPSDSEIVRVLCADPDTAFGNEHTPKHEPPIGRGKAKTTVLTPLYDPDWHLCMETLELHDKKWSDPPGSRWVRYTRPRDCFRVEPARAVRQSGTPPLQIARFALDSTVPPLVTDTLPVAEAVRRNLMGIFGMLTKKATGEKGRSEVFSGKDSRGNPLEGHRHAYFLPTDEDGDGRLDHLTIIASMGFGKGELRAIDLLREIKSREREQSGHPLRALLLGIGTLEDYHPDPLGPSKAWVSATPFVAPRFPKSNGTKRDAPELLACRASFVEATLREELARLQLRTPQLQTVSLDQIEVAPLQDKNGVFRIHGRRGDPVSLRPIQFKRYRRKRNDNGGSRRSGAFRINFPGPVLGPIALGHSSHFGLGLFVPETRLD
jgi:CRISPR-associated protein Csb2